MGRVLLWRKLRIKKYQFITMKRGLSFILIAFLLLIAGKAYASDIKDKVAPETEINTPTGTISGIVMDDQKVSLPGVTLKLNKYNRYTISKTDGEYLFLNVPEGEYILTISYLGFEDFSGKVKVVKGENTIFNIILKDKVFTTGELVVVGDILRGQARAINTERSNVNLTNMVAADQIGRFPDANIGDALKRIPGITMQNDQGEARDIVMRGLAPELNAVTLNGNRIPSAEGDNRRVQMDLMPADMVSMVEVNKTLLPDMDADAIGGSVNLITRKAPNKKRLSFTLGGGYNPIRDGATYNGAMVYGDRYFNNKLGAVLSLSYQNKDYGSDNIEAVWSKDKSDNVYVSQFDIRKYDVQRVRRSASLGLDYKFNPKHDIFANVMYNWRDDRENRFRTRYRKMSPEYDDAGRIVGYTGEVRRETKGGIDNSRNQNRRLEDQRVFSASMGGNHLFGEKLDMKWKVNYAKASEDRPNERYISFQQKKLDISQDLSDGVYPTITASNENVDKFKLKEITENHNYTSEDDLSMKIDFRTPLSLVKEQKGRIRFGAKYKMKNKLRDNIFYEYEPVGDFPSFKELKPEMIEVKNFVGQSKYVPGLFVPKKTLGGFDLTNTQKFTGELVPEEYLPDNYTAKENILAGYLRWDQNITQQFLVILGLRAEYTSIDYLGYTMIDEEAKGEREGNNSYVNLFPNLTLKYQATDNLVLRGAFSTALARPNYYWLVPYTNITSSKAEVSTGNPDLKPTYSYNFDLLGSYYFGNVGLISAGVFYKQVQDFIYKYATTSFTRDQFSQHFPGITNPIEVGEEWEMSQHRNGDNVDLWGVEVAFQRSLNFLPTEFLRRFTVYLNYTYTHSKAAGITDDDGNERENMPLPGSAPHTANASLAWENKWLSLRLSLNHAASYLDTLGEDDFEDGYYGAQTFLDFNANAKVNKNLSIFLEANNLTNQPLYYYQGQKDRLMQIEYYKPTFTAGLKWNL